MAGARRRANEQTGDVRLPRVDDAPLPERTRCRDTDADVIGMTLTPAAARGSSAWLVAAPEIERPSVARQVKPARTVEEARQLDEHRDVSNHPDVKRSEVFVLCPYNVTTEPRRTQVTRRRLQLMLGLVFLGNLRSPPLALASEKRG